METVSIVAGLVSVVLSFLAIGMSLYFFNQSKNTEKNIQVALASIQAQTETLQKLSGKWMDRLTKHVIESNPSPEIYVGLLSVIKELPNNIISQLRFPQENSSVEQLTQELVVCYIALYYYCGLSNVWIQNNLPSIEDFYDNLEVSNLIKRYVDISYSDFVTIDNIINKIDQSRLSNASNSHLLDEIFAFRETVASSDDVYSRRQGNI